MALVYIHRRDDIEDTFLNVFYVGIGKNKQRAFSRSRNIYWFDIVKNTSYTVEITHENIIWEEACIIEKYLVAFYGRNNLGLGNLCNIVDGGSGFKNITEEARKLKSIMTKGANNPFYGKRHSKEALEKIKLIASNRSEETKNKISLSHKGYVWKQEAKNKLIASVSGSKNHFYGKKHSDATKSILAFKRKGAIVPNNIKDKISSSLKGEKCFWFGKKLSIEHKKKLSESKKGKTISEDTKQKLSKNSKKSISLYKVDDNGIVTKYYSYRHLEKMTGINRKIVANIKNRVALNIYTNEELIHSP
jgi:hypothetical protein